MRVLPANASDEDVLAAVQEWVSLLAANDFEAAADNLWNDAANVWGGSAVRTAIERYEAGAPLRGGLSQVTPPETAGGPFGALREVFRSGDGTISSVDFSMPINGEWSELVAFFDVVAVPGGLALSLADMRVA